MATVAGARSGAPLPIEQRDRRFFMAMAVLLALTVLTTFPPLPHYAGTLVAG